MISIIAAVAKNNVIGKADQLPWYIPEDLKRFKQITTGKTVLMGRKTFESILKRLGRPLPNRKNIVITRQSNYKTPEGVVVFGSVDEAIAALNGEDVIVAGGGEIYNQMINRADKLYITEVNQGIEGDTFFPKIDPDVWKEVAREDHEGYSFVEYVHR